MNVLFIKHLCVGCMVYEIPRLSVFGYCPYSVTYPDIIFVLNNILISVVMNTKLKLTCR